MKCLNQKCNAKDIEKDDYFCYQCGHWTAKGYSLLKENQRNPHNQKGIIIKQNHHLVILVCLLSVLFGILSVVFLSGRQDLFRAFYFLKKQAISYIYGYQTTLINTDNQYHHVQVQNYDEAILMIKKDFSHQEYNCFNSFDVQLLANEIEKEQEIPSVSFCDMSLEESKKIQAVIHNLYELFPNIKGALTNITLTNAKTKEEYIARFQPMYQFVNVNENIDSSNQVNKTQILLNSYYFLNENVLTKKVDEIVGEGWYVKDATWESTIAHEFGHYISFVSLLKKYHLPNITFVTAENHELIETVLDEFNQGTHSQELVLEALRRYNQKNNEQLDVKSFAQKISQYASIENQNKNLIFDETIAEAIHDYYLHGENMNLVSKEIIEVIKSKL